MAYKVDKNKKGFSSFQRIASNFQKMVGPAYAGAGTAVPEQDFYELEEAEVIQVVLNPGDPGYVRFDDLGKIKARYINSEVNVGTGDLRWAYPMSSNFRCYPVVGEVVIMAEYFGRRYYMPTLNKRASVNNNIFPGVSLNKLAVKTGGGNSSDYKSKSASGGGSNKGMADIVSKVYKTFVPNMTILPTKVGSGDLVIDGRFGQSIRMSAAGTKKEQYNSPNMFFRVGQRLSSDDPTGFLSKMGFGKPLEENINDDGTSLYMTTNEKIGLITSTAKDTSNKVHSKSWKSPVKGQTLTVPSFWDGKQIILNSDRLIFNSRNNEMVFTSLGCTYFCTSQWFLSDSMKGHVFNSEGQTVIRNKKNTIINSPKIFLGVKDEAKPKLIEGKLEHLVLGETLKKLIEELIDTITKAQYINGAGPASLNPANLPKFMGIKNKLKKILSKQNFTM
tara:strand:- start:7332 stop:8669 length:1338 start_codon:yes stop_codon:yes gene_type:complete